MNQQPSEFIIFITHVEADDVYLKIWGQLDKHAATCVERYIHPLIEQFSQGYGCPSKPNVLINGALCCARFQTDGYFRAKVLSVRPDGMILVQFIDYGNIELLSPNEVHLLENVPGSGPLQDFPAMAAEFTLNNVLPINGVWENNTVETIRKSLCYNEYRASIHPVMNNRCLIKLWYNNEDFSELLVRKRMALPATLQDMFGPKHLLKPQVPLYQQQNKNNLNNYATMPMTQNINQNTSMQRVFCNIPSPGITQRKPVVSQPLPVQEALVFKSRVLDVGSKHEVLVSFVEDGPQKFSVQVQSTTKILSNLMKEINNHSKRPLQEPPLPGSVCLGRYTQDKVLCRAVVMSVMEHKCKLYYVDFGHTEILPYTDIFQLPPEFINPKVLSIRFTLSGLKELNITQDMKNYFKELVSRKLLVLHVRSPEGPPLIQYGDLYDNGVNVKDILKKAFPAPAVVPSTYSYPQLRRLSKDVQEIVHVSFVESCQKFFVQLESGNKSLESIMVGLTQYAKTASPFDITQLKTGLPCAALYESQWYRAEVLSVTGDKIKVLYVDYGNEEIISIMSLRTIHSDLVTKLPAQAIKCVLNGYEVLPVGQEVINHFEKLSLEKRLYMKVVASQSDGLLVDLFEFETKKSIHPQLLNNRFCDKTETSTSSQNGEIQHSSRTSLNLQSEDKDVYNKKYTDSRNQSAKPFQEKSNTWKGEWPQEKQYDNRRGRTIVHSHRLQNENGSQNDRFARDETMNNKFNRDRQYNKYEKSEISTPNRRNEGGFQGGRNKSFGNEPRYNRNNSADKVSSDKDSDTSSKSSGKRGRSSFNRGGARGGKHDNGMSNRLQTAKWNDRNSDRLNHKSGRSNNNSSMSNNKFNKESNISGVSSNQVNTCESWNASNTSKLQTKIVPNKESQIPSINITLGTVKTCEVVFINSPLDFFIQISPNYLELESVMKSITETYENGGEMMQASEIQCDTYCVAQYEEDLKWYRAVIKSIEGNNATVEFVDYGNTNSVDLTKIRAIRKEFLELPMQAIHCKLLGLTNTKNEESNCIIFTEKTEGKSLEVEFVAKENGIFEVLLREIIDGVPKTNYVNEEFCTNAELITAKEIAMNKKTHNTTTKTVHTIPDYAGFDSKWQTILYESGTKHDIIVTWFINPNKFYCQTLTKEREFKAMMNEIQKAYAGRESITHKLEVGSAVIAIFSEDRALYRAEIVSYKQKDYVIRYIDFGNCATVNRRNIYPVEKKFMQLPKLAMQCSLKDIVPINNANWSGLNNNDLDNCFNADKYECIFHNFDIDHYTVSLSYNGQDVGDTLVQKNLAAFATIIPTTTETIDTTETHDVKVEALDDIEKVDISLLNGQILKMKVSSVESTTLFYIQLPSASRCEKIIDKYMVNKNTEVMPRLSSHEMCLGAGCLVNVNGTWRRAVVINYSRSVGFDVKLIDTGAYDEILDGALALPGALAVMQNQALECCLQNVPASADAEKRLKDLEGKEVLVYVEEVNNIRLIVKLYDLLGNGIMNIDGSNEKISPVCPMPILSSTHKVAASCVDHSGSIWLQRYSDCEIETELLKNLQEYYSNSGQKLKPEIHMLCAAKSIDGNWYRGKIVHYTETTAYVSYIDYGNTEEITLDSVMFLEPQFYEPYQLTINVSLTVTLAGTHVEQMDILQTRLLDKEVKAIFYNVHKKWVVDLFENEEKLSDKLRSLNLVKEEEIASKSSQMQEMSTTCKFGVCVSHVDSPSQFWLHRIDEIASLKKNQEKLQLEASDFPLINGIPEEGTLCIAIYSIDNLWYRAEVLDADEDITTVRFIDYGNTDIIDNKADHIRQMPDSWKNIEKSALKCRLDIIPVDTEDWNEVTCERFENLVTSVDTLHALIVANTTPKRVELFINDKSISETLVEEKHAIMINAEQAEPVDEIVDLELDPHSAFVSHINSPSEFWVQEEKSVADLEVMTDRFMVADMFPKIDDVKEGLLCVAKYPEDTQWYRARVLHHDDNGTQVIYIDYGNSSVSTDIRALPEDLADVPALSRKCCLELPPHVNEWSEQACDEFVKLAADGATIFLLDVLKDQETSLVRLSLDGQNVTDLLATLCEQHLPVIEERLPPLGEENSPNVVVSHINSPSEFWVQAESSISELEVMSDRLRDAESFLTLSTLDIGTVCAARYPEDGFWYRAKIIAHHQEGTEVLYMDYGNSAVTEELRVLPEDIVNIPILSKLCALEKPRHVDAWSAEACNKFRELAAEGATMFQFETLDEHDPMHVRLSLNGTNVVDLLLAECENIPKIEEVSKAETENVTLNVEKRKEITNDETVTDSEEQTTNFIDLVEQKSGEMDSTMDSTNNPKCINQTKEPQDVIADEVTDKSLSDSNVNIKCEYTEEHIASSAELDTNSEIATLEYASEVNEASENINITKSDENLIYTNSLGAISLETELSVDDIVGNMVRDTTEYLEVNNANEHLTDANETRSIIKDDAKEQQELYSTDTSEPSNAQILETISVDKEVSDIATRTVTEDLDSKEILSETHETQPQDITLDASQNQEEKQDLHSEMQHDVNNLDSQISEITISDDVSCSPEQQQQTNYLEQIQKQNSMQIETTNGNSDKNNDMEVSNASSESICTVVTAESPSETKIDTPESPSSTSKDRSENNIIEDVSGCETSDLVTPGTPKTPCSEKLVAGAVNPFPPGDCARNDEILTISVEDNIPKYMV